MLHGGQQLMRTPWCTAIWLSYFSRSVKEAALAPAPLMVAHNADPLLLWLHGPALAVCSMSPLAPQQCSSTLCSVCWLPNIVHDRQWQAVACVFCTLQAPCPHVVEAK